MVKTSKYVRSVDGLGLRIAKARLANGWTQRDLSHRTGIAQSRICTIESGFTANMYTRTLFAICDALGVSMDAMLGRNT